MTLLGNGDLTEKIGTLYIIKIYHHVKTGKEPITFADNNIEKRKFHRYKNSILLIDVDTDNILISNNKFFW